MPAISLCIVNVATESQGPNRIMCLVGQFIDFIGYARGGAETNVEGLCRHAVDSRFSFEVVTSKSPFFAPDFQALDAPVLTATSFYRMREASFLFTGLVSDILYRLPGLAYRLGVQKYFNRYDIIHCHSLDVAEMLKRKGTRTPAVLTVYNLIPERYRLSICHLDYVILRSRTLMTELGELDELRASPKIVYIPPGCEFSYYEPIETSASCERTSIADSDVIRLLFVGRLRPFKNLETLLHAVKILNSEQTARFTLTVVGSGPRKMELMTLARDLGVSELVAFAGGYPSVQMGGIYGSHDLVVVPSYYESFSQVSLEALVAQRRLLVSSGLKEFRSAFPDVPVCDPYSPNDMARRILDVIATPVVHVDSGDLSIFDWENVMQAHYDVYASLLDGRPHAGSKDQDLATR